MNIVTAYDINAVVTRYLLISGTNPARANAIKICITNAYNRGLDHAAYADQNDTNFSPYDAKISAAPFTQTITDQNHLIKTDTAIQYAFYDLPGVDGTPCSEILDMVATGCTISTPTRPTIEVKSYRPSTLKSFSDLR